MIGANGVRCSWGSTKNRLVKSLAGSCCTEGTSAGLGDPAHLPHQWSAAFSVEFSIDVSSWAWQRPAAVTRIEAMASRRMAVGKDREIELST